LLGRSASTVIAAPFTLWPPRDGNAGTTVFFMHGAGGRADQWRFVAPALRDAGLGVVAHDAPGHGERLAPRDWRAYAGQAWVAEWRAVIERHSSARNVLVGHSYGGLVALGVLQAGVARAIDRVLLLAPPSPEPLARVPWIAYLPVPVLERLRPRLSAGFRAAAWGADAPVALVNEETVISDRNSFYVFKAMWRQWLHLDRARLSTLQWPVRLLAGEADRLTPPASAEQLAQVLPNATLTVLPRCGHQMPLERPDAVVQALLGQTGRSCR
jgi:pimeloyl-ACP methyl ester carboxylesterase